MRRVAFLSLLPMMAVLAGCGGPSRAAVEGSVTYGGKLVPYGSITFVPQDDGGRQSGDEIVEGYYKIPAAEGPTPGRYKVQIRWTAATDKTRKDENGVDVPESTEGLPQKYNDNTELTADVAPGKNKVDFTLKHVEGGRQPEGAAVMLPGGP